MQRRTKNNSMRGAGIVFNSKNYITHTTLPFALSAAQTFSRNQLVTIAVFGLCVVSGLSLSTLFTIQIFVAVISILYFLDTVFNLVITFRSLSANHEIYSARKDLLAIPDKDLPTYTILCPLYKESYIIPQFIEAIATLDYPKRKLDVILLLEEDDQESIDEVSRMHLPYYFRTIVVPNTKPKTKPKACNYGLSYARGEYLVIYDAEDVPDPMQLKKAYLGFKKVASNIVCLQAKLNYYNARQNLLTRFFAAEYSLWFDLTLTGLQSLHSTIPLGGTSNHFKTNVLRELQGWDPFNVTEDADLGIRLFKKGYQTAMIDSTTYEEATSTTHNWIRQRSRWVKGYMQTYLVHMRTWTTLLKEKGLFHSIIFQLTVGGKLLFLLLNPLMWLITAGYFLAYPLFGPAIEVIYQPPISYIAVTSWIFGNFLFLYYYMLGCAKRDQWDLMKYIFLMPYYWAMMSTAGAVAFYQLLFKPHYWEKTIHGFHLGKVPQVARVPRVPQEVLRPMYIMVQKTLRNLRSGRIRLSELLKVRSSENLSYLSFSGFSPKTILIACLPACIVLLQGSLFLLPNGNIADAATIILYLGVVNIIAVILYTSRKQFVSVIENNINSLFGVIHYATVGKAWQAKRMRILIFNWRDNKHVYAGGAEVYVQELAKRWVKEGNKVTLFCGNDTRHRPNEKVDGVEIIRRGGTYTTYFFAFLYYLLKLRGNYDVIVDCENGIPFFAPLFTRRPVILLIHHVHQEVFRNFLRFPLKQIAALLEGKIMPFVYRNKVIVTVSESSKREILKLGFTKEENIEVIYNGVSSALLVNPPKTRYPSFVYLGRLKEYKNIDIAIKSFAAIVKKFPTARLSIVGSGELEKDLKELVVKLRLKTKVTFFGKVSEKEKASLLSQSWAMVQPSQMEGWGITVIEANACGTPVIASRVNGLKDSVIDGKTGLLVTAQNITQFSRAIRKIIEDSLLRNMLSQNSYVWSKNFNWDKSAYDFYKTIGKCLDIEISKRFSGQVSLLLSKERSNNL